MDASQLTLTLSLYNFTAKMVGIYCKNAENRINNYWNTLLVSELELLTKLQSPLQYLVQLYKTIIINLNPVLLYY